MRDIGTNKRFYKAIFDELGIPLGGEADDYFWADELFVSSVDSKRPILTTSINDIASRSDLADRALFVRLGTLEDAKRRAERELWAEFEKLRPSIFGALLTAMVVGIRHLPETRLEKRPRMADFALWIAACERELPWKAGDHFRAYDKSREDAVETVLGADVVANALQKFLRHRPEGYAGTATELLDKLNEHAPDHVKNQHTWPRAPNALSGILRRLGPALRRVGIIIADAGRDSVTRVKRINISRAPLNDTE